MAVVEIASVRIPCKRCLPDPPSKNTWPKSGPCRCRFIVDFFVGPAAEVWTDIEALVESIPCLVDPLQEPHVDPFEGY
jgi:hypothetical protein